MADNKTSVKDMFLRGIAVLGLIAVLLLGAWGIIQIAVALPGFLGGLGNGVVSVFDRDNEPRATTTPVAPTAPRPTTPAATPAKTPNTSQSGTYAPSGASNRTNLFGASDLSVRILQGQPYGSRYNVTFEIANYGTNVAPQGWVFMAELPIDEDGYPYHSAGQQALYPGDRIIYTLGFDTADYNSYGWDRDEDCDWDEDEDEWDCDDNDRRRNTDEEVVITVDPYGYIYEINERNNSVRLEI